MTPDALREILRRDVVEGARALLGTRVVGPTGSGIIVETEAYRGLDDPGCHAFGKSRMKNMSLFGPPGHAYVYLSYGVHWMLNVTAGEEGEAAGILVRALRPEDPDNTPRDAYRGPGRLARTLGVTPADNGRDLLTADGALRLEPRIAIGEVSVGPRIGLSPGKGEATLWRFADSKELDWVSRPIRSLISSRNPA